MTLHARIKHIEMKCVSNLLNPFRRKFLLRSVMRQSTARQDDLRHVDMEIEASLLPQQRVALTSLCELRDLHAPVNRVPQRSGLCLTPPSVLPCKD